MSDPGVKMQKHLKTIKVSSVMKDALQQYLAQSGIATDDKTLISYMQFVTTNIFKLQQQSVSVDHSCLHFAKEYREHFGLQGKFKLPPPAELDEAQLECLFKHSYGTKGRGDTIRTLKEAMESVGLRHCHEIYNIFARYLCYCLYKTKKNTWTLNTWDAAFVPIFKSYLEYTGMDDDYIVGSIIDCNATAAKLYAKGEAARNAKKEADAVNRYRRKRERERQSLEEMLEEDLDRQEREANAAVDAEAKAKADE
jgi:hypothetical protein